MHATSIRCILLAWLGTGMLSAHSQWVAMPNGPDYRVRSLLFDGAESRLFVFGHFQEAGGQMVNGTTYFEDGQWHPMSAGVESVSAFPVIDAYLWNDSVMISGGFYVVAGLPNTRRIALWDGTAWKSIGGIGANGNAAGMLANADGWIMAGGFTEMGGMSSSGIARFRNGVWENLCVYPDNSGYKHYSAVAEYQGQYVFGGNINDDFPDINEVGVLVNDSLRPMGQGILGDSWVNDMVVYNGKLFVAGEFYAGWGNPGSGIMTWDGANWNDPIPGVQCATQAFDLDVFDGKLFFSSQMLLPGSSDFYTLAMYTPGQICLFGRNLNAAMHPIAGVPGGLYVAPNYPGLAVNGEALNWLAYYDLTQGFDTCLALPTGIGNLEQTAHRELIIHPNPNNGVFQVHLPRGLMLQRIAVYDALGRETGLVAGPTSPTASSISVDLKGNVQGIYFVHANGSDGTIYTGTVVVQ